MRVGSRRLLAKTCLKCGVFKQAEEFDPNYQKYKGRVYRAYSSWCKACKNLGSMSRNRRRNDVSRDFAHYNRQPWLISDIDKLEELVREGFTAAEIAIKLGRTRTSVYNMKRKLRES